MKEHQLLKDRKKSKRKRHCQEENCSPTASSAMVSNQGKALSQDGRAVKVVFVDKRNIQKLGAGKGSSLRRNANIGINRTNCKGESSPVKKARQRRKPGDFNPSDPIISFVLIKRSYNRKQEYIPCPQPQIHAHTNKNKS